MLSLPRMHSELVTKLTCRDNADYYLYKILRAHILPLTNCAFNKQGDQFITGSYDRTCKLWQTETGEELLTLEGHRNVVYAIAFNNPWGDKVITGSFDKTCKVWNVKNGDLQHTYRGHATEIVCLSFNPLGSMVATGSMDNTARLWDVATGECLHALLGHTAEIVSLNFATDGHRIITGSFDHTIKVWDVSTGRCIRTFMGHNGEISSTQVFLWLLSSYRLYSSISDLIFASVVPSIEHAKFGTLRLDCVCTHFGVTVMKSLMYATMQLDPDSQQHQLMARLACST
mmetsp:Transcript_26117/g.84538  ORF Transcript_26117/g.84538 Transcript_26117/m.84538 type:complete len:286 (-) Transcript_26117:1235-2092(-)